MLVTAYCPCTVCCGPGARGITASGRPVSANGGKFVAADPGIPFGTMLVVPGYNEGRPVEVLDRGGAIKGDHVDVFFPTHEQAKRWGAKRLVVGRAQ
jgi:3D (Asp-Asp-Asp) domain-containing protein